MKLSATEKMDRKVHKEMLSRANGEMFTDEAFGITVVVVPACGRPDSEFMQVAVAQCSPEDEFKRKRGELVALERWTDGCMMSVRRNGRCLEDVARDTVAFLTM